MFLADQPRSRDLHPTLMVMAPSRVSLTIGASGDAVHRDAYDAAVYRASGAPADRDDAARPRAVVQRTRARLLGPGALIRRADLFSIKGCHAAHGSFVLAHRRRHP